MSSVLIYNLPETICEADISRLSFAVELAEEFYGRANILPLSLQSFCGLSRVIFYKGNLCKKWWMKLFDMCQTMMVVATELLIEHL
ncbi:uncharacterized protein LOC112039711 isoform X2 [Quercus suber]|uniref:uncharacterized protein LOC112039711 isoform X2 n=1 Tax=Quercus suber TaxID=58331 RepID=UPI000CE1EDE2|nr:uncharacterized protein LOC112039711 isoform X2 [Quercus suber]